MYICEIPPWTINIHLKNEGQEGKISTSGREEGEVKKVRVNGEGEGWQI
jgi:hypothetical protein